jgi:hypothetical protein
MTKNRILGCLLVPPVEYHCIKTPEKGGKYWKTAYIYVRFYLNVLGLNRSGGVYLI